MGGPAGCRTRGNGTPTEDGSWLLGSWLLDSWLLGSRLPRAQPRHAERRATRKDAALAKKTEDARTAAIALRQKAAFGARGPRLLLLS